MHNRTTILAALSSSNELFRFRFLLGIAQGFRLALSWLTVNPMAVGTDDGCWPTGAGWGGGGGGIKDSSVQPCSNLDIDQGLPV